MSGYTDKALQTRERILRAAVELFYLHGFNATGLERVITAAGVTKGNFYYYFKSKEELAVEALRWQREQAGLALGINEPLDGGSPLQRLFTTIQRMKEQVTFGGTCQVRGCYFGNLSLEMSAASEAVRKELVATFAGMRAHFADLLRKAGERGEIGAGIEPAPAAAMILSLLEGAVLLSKTSQSPDEIDAAIGFIRTYLGGQ